MEIEREEDGRSIAEIPAIPGALCYAASKEEALVKVTALALRILPEQNSAGILVRVVYLRRAEIAVIVEGLQEVAKDPFGHLPARFTCGALRAFWPSLTGTIPFPLMFQARKDDATHDDDVVC